VQTFYDCRSLEPEFLKAISQHKILEGHSGTLPKQMLVLHYLAGRPAVRSVCETGFNIGHSSFNFLTASRQSVVHSFDVGHYPYTEPMARFMTATFPGRFSLHVGDSGTTVPKFIRANPDFRCDVIFVDGGHNYDNAFADLSNLIPVVNRSNADSVIILDDYPTLPYAGQGVGNAWEDVRRSRSIVELMRCMFSHEMAPPSAASLRGLYQRGFVVGMPSQP